MASSSWAKPGIGKAYLAPPESKHLALFYALRSCSDGAFEVMNKPPSNKVLPAGYRRVDETGALLSN
jgi:hypothetical protein